MIELKQMKETIKKMETKQLRSVLNGAKKVWLIDKEMNNLVTECKRELAHRRIDAKYTTNSGEK